MANLFLIFKIKPYSISFIKCVVIETLESFSSLTLGNRYEVHLTVYAPVSLKVVPRLLIRFIRLVVTTFELVFERQLKNKFD